MRRRIALAILATVWAMLLAAGAASYWATRSVLLTDLDARLAARAAAVPELAADGNPATPPPPRATERGDADDGGERYVVRNEGDRRTVPRAVPPTPAPPASGDGGPRVLAASFATLADGRRVRSVTVRVRVRRAGGDGSAVVAYSGSAEAFHGVLERLAWTLGVGGAAAGLAAAGIAYRVSSAALRPLRDVARTVGSIGERHLDRRIAVADLPPELGPVGRRLNRMLAKLEEAFARRRRFLADASHELRTPVAALVTGLEVTLSRPRTPDAYRARLTEALADAAGLRGLVERLTEQVRGEAFGSDEPLRDVAVALLLADALRSARPLARLRGIDVRTACPPGLRARVRPAGLTSVLVNLLSNAIDYNRPGGSVDLSAEAVGGDLRLTVADAGVGIAPEQQAAVFEPFVRGDAARTGGDGHSGLGLFLVRTHLAAMGARWTMRSELGVGTEFDITLPTAARPDVAGEPETPDVARPSERPASVANEMDGFS